MTVKVDVRVLVGWWGFRTKAFAAVTKVGACGVCVGCIARSYGIVDTTTVLHTIRVGCFIFLCTLFFSSGGIVPSDVCACVHMCSSVLSIGVSRAALVFYTSSVPTVYFYVCVCVCVCV